MWPKDQHDWIEVGGIYGFIVAVWHFPIIFFIEMESFTFKG